MTLTRRGFFGGSIAVAATSGLKGAVPSPAGKLQGFDESPDAKTGDPWEPFSDKKVRVGIAGYGVCAFGATFSF